VCFQWDRFAIAQLVPRPYDFRYILRTVTAFRTCVSTKVVSGGLGKSLIREVACIFGGPALMLERFAWTLFLRCRCSLHRKVGKGFAWECRVFDVMISGRDASLLVFRQDLGS